MTDPTELQWDLFGLTIGSGTVYDVDLPYGILGTVEAAQVGADNGYQPGHVFSHARLPAREFGFRIDVNAEADFTTLKSYLGKAHQGGQTFRMNTTGSVVERLNGVSLIDYEPDGGDAQELSLKTYRVDVKLRAADPIIYTDATTTLNLNTAGTASGTVTNAGNYGPTHLPGLWTCVITAGGSGCTGPKLANGASVFGGAAVLDAHDVTLAAGATLTITAQSERIVNGSGTSVWSSCRGATAGSLPEFFPLVPGAQTITLSCASGACTAAFTYRSTRL